MHKFNFLLKLNKHFLRSFVFISLHILITGCIRKASNVFSASLKTSPLHEAVALSDITKIKKTLQESIVTKKVDVNDKDDLGFTALHVTAFSGCESIEMLITYGANVLETDADGNTALHWAAYTGNIPLIKSLRKHNANINVRTFAFLIKSCIWITP